MRGTHPTLSSGGGGGVAGGVTEGVEDFVTFRTGLGGSTGGGGITSSDSSNLSKHSCSMVI